MTHNRDETDPAGGSNPRQPPRKGSPHTSFDQLEGYPELIAVVAEAVERAVTNSSVDREHDSDLVEDVERAAATAALTTHQRLTASALQASDSAGEDRRTQARSNAATGAVIAERVTEAATALHAAEEASADPVALVAEDAASAMATTVRLDDEAAASTAAGVVVEAVREAAAVKTRARAEAASQVAHAAADAAAAAAAQAASTASTAEVNAITDSANRHQQTLEACYEVAAATATAMLTHLASTHPRQPHQHPADNNDAIFR